MSDRWQLPKSHNHSCWFRLDHAIVILLTCARTSSRRG